MNESHTYEGGAFDPALPGGRRGGLLEITAGGLRFLTPDGTHEALHLPLDGLKVALPRQNSILQFLILV